MRIKAKDRIGEEHNMKRILDWRMAGRRSEFYIKCLHCNNKRWMRADSVLDKQVKGCGCLQKTTQYVKTDLTGKRFERLEVMKSVGKDEFGQIYRCVCDCGNVIDVSGYLLVRGSVKSCGCLQIEKAKQNIPKLKAHQEKVCIEGTNLDIISRKKLISTNTSGHVGVTWDKAREKWVAQIEFKGKNHYLGRFDDKEAAIKARLEGEEKYFKPILEKVNRDDE